MGNIFSRPPHRGKIAPPARGGGVLDIFLRLRNVITSLRSRRPNAGPRSVPGGRLQRRRFWENIFSTLIRKARKEKLPLVPGRNCEPAKVGEVLERSFISGVFLPGARSRAGGRVVGRMRAPEYTSEPMNNSGTSREKTLFF